MCKDSLVQPDAFQYSRFYIYKITKVISPYQLILSDKQREGQERQSAMGMDYAAVVKTIFKGHICLCQGKSFRCSNLCNKLKGILGILVIQSLNGINFYFIVLLT